ncbi:MAG: hypothetical protein AAF715_22160 [Myxococcota bacterium]
MTDPTSPPSSSLRRAVERDTVRDVMLLESGGPRRRTPVPLVEGEVAPLEALRGRIRRVQESDAPDEERPLALELAREHFERALDVDLAVQLLHRALEIEDDRGLRRHLAGQLSTMGRHVEAGHVLRDGEPVDAHDVYDAWLRSGGAYARAGDADETIAILRDAAVAMPDAAAAYEGIAAVAYWAPELVAAERAADAFLEAARRYPEGSDAQQLAILRAVEVAPGYARAAEALSRRLTASGRSRERDEVWRRYGLASGHALAVARRRAEDARDQADWAIAFIAAFEAAVLGGTSDDREEGVTVASLLQEGSASRAWLAAHRAPTASPFDAQALLAATTQPAAARGAAIGFEAASFDGEAGAMLFVLASDALEEAEDQAGALAALRSGIERAPWFSVPHARFLDRADRDAIGREELERAVGAVPGTATRWLHVAERYLADGEPAAALAWLKRVVALRPGDADALVILLERAAESTPQRHAEAIDLALSDRRPWRDLTRGLSASLRRLVAEDSELALEAAHRTLKTVGPGDDDLFAALLHVAEVGDDPLLALGATLGHAVGDEVPDDARGQRYADACARSLALGDPVAASIHLGRAAAHGGAESELEALLPAVRRAAEDLPGPPRSDVHIALAEVRASAAESDEADVAIETWRQLGAARFDLAQDLSGADDAFFAVATLEPEAGPYAYAYDLCDRAGPEVGLRRVAERALRVEQEGRRELCGRLYAAVARIATENDRRDLALDAAVAAVRSDPQRADAVAVVETIATHTERGVTALAFVYDTLADAARGKYGYRAAHYRAARQLEKLGAHREALRHAVLAFEAVPSIGASCQMLLRLATRADAEEVAVDTLVATAADAPVEAQLAWFVRAAEVARQTPASVEVRIDLLLRAWALRPRLEVAEALEDAAASLPPDGVGYERLERAVREGLARLETTHDAATAIVLARMSARTRDRTETTVDALLAAAELDPQGGDFTPSFDALDTVSAARAPAQRLLDGLEGLRARIDGPFSSSLQDVVSRLVLAVSGMPTPAPEPAAEERASLPPIVVAPATDLDPMSTAVTQIPPARPLSPEPLDPFYDAVTVSPPPPADLAVTSGRDDVLPGPIRPEPRAPTAPAVVASEFRLATEDEHDDDPVVETEEVEVDALLLREIDTHVEEESARLELSSLDLDATRDEGGGDTSHLPPADLDYSPASERAARERGDHAAIAAMLAARARATDNLDQRRLVRLRRAAVLEQRLGRIDEACAELERILEEVSEDPTALRYLADLSDRRHRHARAARLWLRASQRATEIDERLRDVTRCCSSLLAADRPETARRLIEAARGLPQSPRLLELRIEVAERLGDDKAKAEAEGERTVLDAPAAADGDDRHGDGVGLAEGDGGDIEPDASGDREQAGMTHVRRRRPERARRLRARTGERGAGQIFRVTGAPPPVDDDADRSPAEVLDACRRQYREQGPGNPREAKRMIRRLRSVAPHTHDGDRDLYTYLLVECLDAAQGTGAATHALQQHWENVGGTPLVTLAVADRLARRNDLKPALRLYRRSLERDLAGVRNHGGVALQAAEVAQALGEGSEARRYLAIAAHDEATRPKAELRHATWFPGSPRLRPASDPPDAMRRGAATEGIGWTPAPVVEAPIFPPPETAHSSRVPTERPPSAPPPLDADGPTRAEEPPPDLERLALDEDLGVRPPADDAVSRGGGEAPESIGLHPPPTLPELESATEEALFRELVDGSYEAGDALVMHYRDQGPERSRDVLSVRRYQVRLRRGERRALDQLHEAALADSAEAYARAIAHVATAFDPQRAPVPPPPLEDLPVQPEATTRLLFGALDDTVNDALGLVWEAGVMRREMSDYDFTGIDRVPPVATTPLGRVFAALNRLLDLGGARLFYRARTTGRLRSRVALVSPLAAILSGTVEEVTPAVLFTLGSALAAASPRLALIEGVDESDAQTLVAALVAGFGPVTEGSIAESSPAQMRLAEDLWHLVSPGAGRRLRAICADATIVSYDVARINAARVRRRAGLFACGDLVTAIAHTLQELERRSLRPLRGEDALRDVCGHPEVAELFDLALRPEFAEVRWRTA